MLRFCARRVLAPETAVDLCAETFAGTKGAIANDVAAGSVLSQTLYSP